MKSKKLWTILIALMILAGTAVYTQDSLLSLLGGMSGQVAAQTTTTSQTVTVRSATDTTQVSAAGNIAVADEQSLVFQAEGIVSQINVEPGDTVKAEDILVTLDTTSLEREVERAQLSLETSQNELTQLQEPASEAEIASAKATLAAAAENLAELQAGPTAADLAAAQSALTAAQSSYDDLLAGASEAEVTELSADVHKAYITLQQAQEAYNQISYQNNIGSTQEAMDLQTATIDYDTAKAALEVSTAAASEADIQAALQSIKEAQANLAALAATQSEVTSASAEVAEAQANLDTLLDGPSTAEVEAAELTIAQAQLDLEEAQANLEQAQLLAPVDGTILTVGVETGQQATAETTAVTLADLSDLELTLNVAEVDIPKVELGQAAEITLDALPGQSFSGLVSRIVPASSSDSGVVNYEVVLQLDDLTSAAGVLPGMTAVATIKGDSTENTWLVPTNALVEAEGQTTIVVVRDGQESRISVTPGTVQGEWTTVQSTELQSGDQVVGSVTSLLAQESSSSNQMSPDMGGGAPPQ